MHTTIEIKIFGSRFSTKTSIDSILCYNSKTCWKSLSDTLKFKCQLWTWFSLNSEEIFSTSDNWETFCQVSEAWRNKRRRFVCFRKLLTWCIFIKFSRKNIFITSKIEQNLNSMENFPQFPSISKNSQAKSHHNSPPPINVSLSLFYIIKCRCFFRN